MLIVIGGIFHDIFSSSSIHIKCALHSEWKINIKINSESVFVHMCLISGVPYQIQSQLSLSTSCYYHFQKKKTKRRQTLSNIQVVIIINWTWITAQRSDKNNCSIRKRKEKAFLIIGLNWPVNLPRRHR